MQTVRTVRAAVTAIIIGKCFAGVQSKKLHPFLFVIEIMNLVLKKFYGVKCIQNYSELLKIKGETNLEYVFYGLLAAAFIAFVVLVIRSYKKKLASGCCGASDETVKKNKVADKDKSHYLYEKTLVVDGMVCKNCSARVENALNSIDGVWAEADVSSGRVTVRMKREIEDKVLKKTVNGIGSYTVMKVE